MLRNIKELGTWYQIIQFEKYFKTSGVANCGDPLWPSIRNLLPKYLKRKRILDLGCNAGIYCVRAALEGAEVVGVESLEQWMAQARFVKEYFEKKHKRKLNITYIQNRIEEVYSDLGKFDVVLATAFLYHVSKPKQKEIVDWICSITDNVIARYRGEVYMEKFSPMFEKNGLEIGEISNTIDKRTYYLVQYRRRK